MQLQRGDRLLLAGRIEARRQLSWIERNHNSFAYLMTGHEKPSDFIWKYVSELRKASAEK